ncbi:Phosphoglucomutase [Smittium culicis]|uniref:phosphoglucomutase (alpha-D-glucose-1,6-bisphosphate-dependent) n=1 Tax=Smittium culicis TaxID=133412 RepID=A0A1R1Y3V6_9FUNG|nr:Phosphoglucomutase [Smittium culicis]OMJ07335.1 Phosphoglucomutase [Smittium culicis]OMJ15005.1 Phosphoglucomutase [Smittium culicis]OMJ21661.1 Phosphoglucomutase [Smittium culicis]
MSGSPFTINTIKTTPYLDQKPGTSGLRKKVRVFMKENYTENFVQSVFDAMPSPGPVNSTIVVGGDGRYYLKDVIQKIIKIGAANGVKKLIIGKDGIFSTPAVSNIIRTRNANGGILLTASHNPGGIDNDFGLKYNVSNGGPAPENITDMIFTCSKTISEYKMADIPDVDLSKITTTKFGDFEIEVIDSVIAYTSMIKEIFDIELIKSFLQKYPDFKILFDGLNGVTGPYGKSLFVEELGLPLSSIDQCVPLEDFGGEHPDPNLTYAHKLVVNVEKNNIDLGAASDGDGDRNMIISNDWFVNPSDSVAVIADYAAEAIPYFKKTGLKGLARSMPTSASIDRVAEAHKVQLFEVPTGWKFFGNLMDAGKLSVCGEESFGTGSDHIREKDGLWAIIAWLNIIAHESMKQNKLVTIKSIMQNHFSKYGRNYFSRYDYEEVDSDAASKMYTELKSKMSSELVGQMFGSEKLTIVKADDFSYTDPIDKSVSKNQGLRLIFKDGSRIVVRLSGTGSSGATIRLYYEMYENRADMLMMDTQEALKPLIDISLKITKLEEYTGRKEPTVIT